MSFLLKIVEGPMKGAEIALVDGLRVKVGSGDACDIVIADGSLPEVAFELDVAAESVSLINGEDARVLKPLEVAMVGTTGIAVGPADEIWGALVYPKAAEAPAADAAAPASAPSTEPAPTPAEAEGGEVPPVAKNPLAGETAPAGDTPAKEPIAKWRIWFWSVLTLLVLLVAAALYLWKFRPADFDRCMNGCRAAKDTCIVWFKSAVAWTEAKIKDPPPPVVPRPKLEDIAAEAHLKLTMDNGVPLISGNLKRRTERLAIRALALAANPAVRFDLTDDESLLASSDELLFVVSEGSLKAIAATNRVVTIVGYAESAAALEKTVRALNADVKGIERLVTKGVQVGGARPKVPIGMAAMEPAAPVYHEAPVRAEAPRAQGAKTPVAHDYPIAGILTAPYACVVLRNGMRLTEGAIIGRDSVIEAIKPDRLVLRNGSTVFEWRP